MQNPSALQHKDLHIPPRLQGKWREKKEIKGRAESGEAPWFLHLFYKKERERERDRKKVSEEPPLSHAERCRGMPEVQTRLAGMKSFASGANRRLLFISSAYRFAVVIFGDAEGHLKEFLMRL